MTTRNGSTIGCTSYNLPNVIMASPNSSTLYYGANGKTQSVPNRNAAWFSVPFGQGHPGTGLATRPETLYYL